jgi:hypothetical protein
LAAESGEEVQSAQKRRPTAEQAFKDLDRDANGRVTREEFLAKRGRTEERKARAEKQFTKLDKDADGELALDEYRAGTEKRAKADKGDQKKSPKGRKLRLPVEMTVRQRTTTAVPGFDGELRLTIDDVTAGQVMVSLAGKDGSLLLAPTSMESDDTLNFKVGDEPYSLTLEGLSNSLIGDDFATFVVSGAGDARLSQRAKIERLIQSIEKLEDATFIRNDVEYDADEAAEHLRMKWRAQADEISSAQVFIDRIASRSSVSDEAYRIRMSDGSVVEAGDFLRKRLEEIEDEHATTSSGASGPEP